jgi:hypothetical protein
VLVNQQKETTASLSRQKMKYAQISLREDDLLEKQMEKHIREKATVK